jgi:hypothetical protein
MRVRQCAYTRYVYVNFKTKGNIEEPVNNVHNDHERTDTTARSRVYATAEQKALMDTCIRDGNHATPA